MATYRVWTKVTSYAYLDVKADSKEEAERKADEADGGQFTTCEDGDWEIMPDQTTEVA